MADAGIKCPKCGHDNLTSSVECTKCGISFEIYNKEKAPAERQQEQSGIPVGNGAGSQTDHLANCPNCGHATDMSADDCLKCGIIFAKYFEIQERELANAPEKLKALQTQRESHEKAAAERRKEEAKEAAKRRKQQQIESEKLEALKKQQAEQARIEASERREAEKEKQEALNAQQEAFERHKLDLKKQSEKETQEALANQLASHQNDEAAYKEQAERERQEALKTQEEAHERYKAELAQQGERDRLEALKKQKEAFLEADAEIKRQAELKLQQALDLQKTDLQSNREADEVKHIVKNLPAPSDVQEMLKKYEGQTVGVNHEDPDLVDPAVLVRVADDHFSVLPPGSGGLYSYPFTVIASTVEEITGIPVGSADKQKTVFLVVKLFH